MSSELGWGLAVCLVLLLALAVAAARVGRLGVTRDQVIAALRAVVQLTAVSLVITAAVLSPWGTIAFVALMFGVAAYTTAKRVDAVASIPWIAVALAGGAIPVLTIVLATGAVPLTGISVVPISGIIIGNCMTAHTLVARRTFAELSANIGGYEAALSLGFTRPQGVMLLVEHLGREALIPNLDQTRTVGLVTLPGAFVGVLLGGGTPLQAGSAQVLVLFAIMAGQAITTGLTQTFISRGHILSPALRERLRP